MEVWVRSDMRYFPIDRRLAIQCSGHNPDDIWSANTGNHPSKARHKRHVAFCADIKPVSNSTPERVYAAKPLPLGIVLFSIPSLVMQYSAYSFPF
jgi:hypothetical protein